MPGATEPALFSLFLPIPPTPQRRSATERGWPSPCGPGSETKHFWVSELSKRLGCSARPESRERRGAGGARPPPGARVPLKTCSCSIWGSGGAESFGSLSRRASSVPGRGEPSPSHPEARPGQPAGARRPGCVWLRPFLLVMANEGQAPQESLSSQRHSRWETEERLGASWRSYPL